MNFIISSASTYLLKHHWPIGSFRPWLAFVWISRCSSSESKWCTTATGQRSTSCRATGGPATDTTGGAMPMVRPHHPTLWFQQLGWLVGWLVGYVGSCRNHWWAKQLLDTNKKVWTGWCDGWCCFMLLYVGWCCLVDQQSSEQRYGPSYQHQWYTNKVSNVDWLMLMIVLMITGIL